MIDIYANYKLEPIAYTGDGTRQGFYGNRYVDTNDTAMATMRDLGFQKVAWHCVYKGDVAKLVEALNKQGWYALPHRDNAFLLQHDDSVMVFNYANGSEPDAQYISFFRGSYPV